MSSPRRHETTEAAPRDGALQPKGAHSQTIVNQPREVSHDLIENDFTGGAVERLVGNHRIDSVHELRRELVPHSREANTMVGSLIELGHNLGLKICAEGVENRAALDMLAILRCDRCQGFFISRAVPARDIPSLVSHWNRESPAASAALSAAAV